MTAVDTSASFLTPLNGFKSYWTLVAQEKFTKKIERQITLPDATGAYGPIFLSDNSTPEGNVTLQGRHLTAAEVATHRGYLYTRLDETALATTTFKYTTIDGQTYTGVVSDVSAPREDGTNRYSITITLWRTDV